MPIHTIWIAGEVMRGLHSTHGDSKLAGQEALSNAKAKVIYRILDANPDIYQPVNYRDVRSRMNICFRVKDLETERQFLTGAEERLLQGLKGHRSVVSHLYKSMITYRNLGSGPRPFAGAVNSTDQPQFSRCETSRVTDLAEFRAGFVLPTITVFQWTISISWPST